MDILKMLDAAIWYVIGDDVYFVAGGMVALAIVLSILLLIGASRVYRVG
jgi:hypothetical protein